MCKCTPNIRTPFCGKPGCEWPKQKNFIVIFHTNRVDPMQHVEAFENEEEAFLKEIELKGIPGTVFDVSVYKRVQLKVEVKP